MSASGFGDLDRLLAKAETLAASLGRRAAEEATLGRERAILRLFGVHGLDRDGRPLAAEAVERYVAGSPERLARGITLPFAMALVVYETQPQQLALDVASGAVDLALEAEGLADPDRRALAEDEARRLAAAALERVDANRTARHELIALLGDPPRPWVEATLVETSADASGPEIEALVRGGADCIRVSVPAGRELTTLLEDAGAEAGPWRSRRRGRRTGGDIEPAPSGSQRGLSAIRDLADRVAAERGSYVRLGTVSPPLAAPEQAVVAAFERVDIIETDLMGEIVDGRVDPERALADHAFAHAIAGRSGALVSIASGPLVVGTDIARGFPSSPAARAGRAFALQALAILLARRDGLTDDRIVAGALPTWMAEEREPVRHALAQVMLRRTAFPDVRLAFEEPHAAMRGAAMWPFVLAAVLPLAAPLGIVARQGGTGAMTAVSAQTRAAAGVASELSVSLEPARFAEPTLELVRSAIAAGIETLERLDGEGWDEFVGGGVHGTEQSRLGGDAVAEVRDPFDPFAGVPGSAWTGDANPASSGAPGPTKKRVRRGPYESAE